MIKEGETHVDTLAALQAVIAEGRLHHCTVRDAGRMFEALHVYVNDENGFRGFRHVGSIHRRVLSAMEEVINPEYKAAIEVTRGNWHLGTFNT